jgi:hypothetical protein
LFVNGGQVVGLPFDRRITPVKRLLPGKVAAQRGAVVEVAVDSVGGPAQRVDGVCEPARGGERVAICACQVGGTQVSQHHAGTGGAGIAHHLANPLLHGELRFELAELAVEMLQLRGPLPQNLDMIGGLPGLHGGVDRGVDRIVDDPLGADRREQQEEENEVFHGVAGWGATGAGRRCWFWMSQYCSFTACP